MKVTWMGAALGGLLFVTKPAPVAANVLYTFNPRGMTYADGEPDPRLESGVGFTLELKDAAFDRGHFYLSGSVTTFIASRKESLRVTRVTSSVSEAQGT